jgi:hypothetical protein
MIKQLETKLLKNFKSQEKVDIFKLLKNFLLKRKPNVWISLNFKETHNENDNDNINLNDNVNVK